MRATPLPPRRAAVTRPHASSLPTRALSRSPRIRQRFVWVVMVKRWKAGEFVSGKERHDVLEDSACGPDDAFQ